MPIQVREPKQSAQGGTEGRGGILLQNGEIWEIFAGSGKAKRGPRGGVSPTSEELPDYGIDLLKWAKEFQTKQTPFSQELLAQDLGHDGRRLARY